MRVSRAARCLMAVVMGNPVFPRPAAAGLRILAVAAAYFVAGRIGLLEQMVVGGAKVTPLWPPTGISVTCLLLLGPGIWPGIALGAFCVVASIGPLNLAAPGIVLGSTLAPVCAWLMLRKAGFRIELDRLRSSRLFQLGYPVG